MIDELIIPYAVSLLILRKDYKVLGVSRKDDPDNFGLPGGKVEKDESPRQAIVRETREETGLEIWKTTPIFTSVCKKDSVDGVDYLNITFISNSINGVAKQQEGEGRVAWIPFELLFFGSFGDYNLRLIESLGLDEVSRSVFYTKLQRRNKKEKLLSQIEEL